MEALRSLFYAMADIMNISITLFGFTFTLFNMLVFLAVAFLLLRLFFGMMR